MNYPYQRGRGFRHFYKKQLYNNNLVIRMRFFNTAGPCKIDDHYTVPPLERFDLDDILMLIDQKKYFVLHAPGQTGKTTLEYMA